MKRRSDRRRMGVWRGGERAMRRFEARAPVGRKSRRAVDVPFPCRLSAPDLSRFVGLVLPRVVWSPIRLLLSRHGFNASDDNVETRIASWANRTTRREFSFSSACDLIVCDIY